MSVSEADLVFSWIPHVQNNNMGLLDLPMALQTESRKLGLDEHPTNVWVVLSDYASLWEQLL